MNKLSEKKGLPYIVLISLHGLIRGVCPELGRDLDTGGQVTYVLELSKALGKYAIVHLLTRLVDDPDISPDYAQPEEKLAENVKLIRISCGPKKYVRKELLWPLIPEFTDGAIQHILGTGLKPCVVHGHYADGALAATNISDILGLPMAFTGHSMGRTKLKSLLENMSYAKINNQFKIYTRIEAEERALMSTNLLISNSNEEINTQWRLLYDGFRALESLWSPIALRPGIGMKKFEWTKGEEEPEIWKTIDGFFSEGRKNKPIVLVLARPAAEKNITTMIETFGESEKLQDLCNLIIIAGQRNDIEQLSTDQKQIVYKILYLIDKYNLYGKCAYPKQHKRDDVPAIFALPAYRNGLFANIALREPFGLTLVEAAVNGCPLIATRNGAGPEIVEYLQNGVVVDPTDKKAIEEAIISIVCNPELHQKYSKNSLEKSSIYSWEGHIKQYLELLKKVQNTCGTSVLDYKKTEYNKDTTLLICDIDNTLLGNNNEAKEGFCDLLKIIRNNSNIKLGIATGRSINSAIDYLNQHDNRLLNECVFIISSCGTEIHYIKKLKCKKFDKSNEKFDIKILKSDENYHRHISYRFSKDDISIFLQDNFPQLKLQDESTGHSLLEQRCYKLSYIIKDEIIENYKNTIIKSPQLLSIDNPLLKSSPNPVLLRKNSGTSLNTYFIDEEYNEEHSEDNDKHNKYFSLDQQQQQLQIHVDNNNNNNNNNNNDDNNSQEETNSNNTLQPPINPIFCSYDSNNSLRYAGSSYNMCNSNLSKNNINNSMNNILLNNNYSELSLETQKNIMKESSNNMLNNDDDESLLLNSYLHSDNIIDNIKSSLRRNGLVCEIIYSNNKYIDILPIRASKGKAIRYLMAKMDLNYNQIITCGDSGNDIDMLSGLIKGIVVGNYTKELNTLKHENYLYFSNSNYAYGIIEGLKYYNIIP